MNQKVKVCLILWLLKLFVMFLIFGVMNHNDEPAPKVVATKEGVGMFGGGSAANANSHNNKNAQETGKEHHGALDEILTAQKEDIAAKMEAEKDTRPRAILHTGVGDITFLLLPEAAPKTVENFIKHSTTGFYNGTTLYRYERDFCLQGGAWPKKSSPYPPVPLEYKLPNKMYFVSMARTSEPVSATCEFSIMLRDNSQWLGPGGSEKYGYAVFAQVVEGIDVIEKFKTLKTKKQGLTLLDPPVVISNIEIRR